MTDVSKNPEPGQVTVMHLFLGIAFFMPITAATIELKHFGGGTLRYLVAASLALALGAAIVCLDWKLGKTVWLRCQRYSQPAQNAVAIALFAVELLWIVAGGISGIKLAAFVAERVQR